MRFKKFTVVFLLFAIMLFSSVRCYANTFEDCLSGSAVNVIECASSIDIFAYVSIEGELKDVYFNDSEETYSELFLLGVRSVWNGNYKGKTVSVHIEEIPDDYEGEYVTVYINLTENENDYCRASKSGKTIYMYSGDGRTKKTYYNRSGFMYVSGHEFGHILGLANSYDDENEYVSKYLISPMGAWNTYHAQDTDYYLLLKYRTWESDGYCGYSADYTVLEFLMNRINCENVR